MNGEHSANGIILPPLLFQLPGNGDQRIPLSGGADLRQKPGLVLRLDVRQVVAELVSFGLAQHLKAIPPGSRRRADLRPVAHLVIDRLRVCPVDRLDVPHLIRGRPSDEIVGPLLDDVRRGLALRRQKAFLPGVVGGGRIRLLVEVAHKLRRGHGAEPGDVAGEPLRVLVGVCLLLALGRVLRVGPLDLLSGQRRGRLQSILEHGDVVGIGHVQSVPDVRPDPLRLGPGQCPPVGQVLRRAEVDGQIGAIDAHLHRLPVLARRE